MDRNIQLYDTEELEDEMRRLEKKSKIQDRERYIDILTFSSNSSPIFYKWEMNC